MHLIAYHFSRIGTEVQRRRRLGLLAFNALRIARPVPPLFGQFRFVLLALLLL